ncbi:YegS/Rv2252/BmrU family lipid kinase [Peptacetobacter sp.]|uniref:YegS/Rv2252/BmrU family lipid kinase n=1 Tax=Peptacetobacter sp. TaxID=2991975 RepID=UPI0026069952|nr:YegS/Rv2252/BmrU family lipid kinase [Peptacetobacter sp.]
MKKVKFIYNPNSGEKKLAGKLDSIIRIYQKNGYTMIPYRLDYDIPAGASLEDVDDSYDHIVICGGDGTVDLMVNELKRKNIDIPIGIIPSGTANDFANALGLEHIPEEAIKNIISSKPKKIDLGRVNNKYFVNVASAGMFTDVSQKINNDIKNSFGRITYYIKGMEEAMSMREFYIDVKSEEVNYSGNMYLMLVFNGKTAGNINLAYKAEVDDGYLDVIIFKGMPLPKTIPVLIGVLKGEHLDFETDNEILYFKTKKVNIKCDDDLITDIDGEKGPDFPLEIECIKDSLSILGIEY